MAKVKVRDRSVQGTPDEIRRRYNLEEEKVSGSNFSLPEFISIDEPNEILGVDGTLEIDGNVYINTKKLAAWVVDSGTTDGWHWKKYSDGTYEAWGIFNFKPTSSTASGNTYYSNTGTISLPFTVVDGVAIGAGNTEVIWIGNPTVTSSSTVTFRIGKGNTISTSTTYKLRFYVVGTY